MKEVKPAGFARRDFIKGAVSTALAAGVIGLGGTGVHAAPAAGKKHGGRRCEVAGGDGELEGRVWV